MYFLAHSAVLHLCQKWKLIQRKYDPWFSSRLLADAWNPNIVARPRRVHWGKSFLTRDPDLQRHHIQPRQCLAVVVNCTWFQHIFFNSNIFIENSLYWTICKENEQNLSQNLSLLLVALCRQYKGYPWILSVPLHSHKSSESSVSSISSLGWYFLSEMFGKVVGEKQGAGTRMCLNIPFSYLIFLACLSKLAPSLQSTHS